jgi:ribosome maturation factor RimP
MNISEEIRGVVESQLADNEFVVDIVIKGIEGAQKLIVLVDSDDGLTIDKCSKISKNLSGYLEENEIFDSAFTLEVSSPGLDHPLKLRRQYLKNVGRGIKIRTNDGQEIEGILKNLKEEQVEIELNKSKGEKSVQKIEIPFTKIDRAMVLVSFK